MQPPRKIAFAGPPGRVGRHLVERPDAYLSVCEVKALLEVIVNDVKTLVDLAHLPANGAESYGSTGTRAPSGSMVSTVGHVATGPAELDLGLPLDGITGKLADTNWTAPRRRDSIVPAISVKTDLQ
jgi:hypothetical protein